MFVFLYENANNKFLFIFILCVLNSRGMFVCVLGFHLIAGLVNLNLIYRM
jgi:hypothetical protein